MWSSTSSGRIGCSTRCSASTRAGGLIAIMTPPFRVGEYLKSFDYGLSAQPIKQKLRKGRLDRRAAAPVPTPHRLSALPARASSPRPGRQPVPDSPESRRASRAPRSSRTRTRSIWLTRSRCRTICRPRCDAAHALARPGLPRHERDGPVLQAPYRVEPLAALAPEVAGRDQAAEQGTGAVLRIAEA